MAKGECNCGSVAFEISKEISDVYICHCSICRRSTGSGAIAVVVVENTVFSWTRGQELINCWKKPNHDWHTYFCQNCGSSLPGANDDERMYVPVGLIIQGAENLKVSHHLWVGSKASWEDISESGKQHREGFEG
jgi:hypothetical protein